MPYLWDWLGKDDDIWRDVERVKRRLKELRVQNTRKDIQQWMNKCLWKAALYDQFAVCEYLVGQGGDPTRRYDERHGDTAIDIAASNNLSRILQLFMDGGWSPDVTDIYGLTPLWWAGYEGDKDCVEILLSRGADPLYERTQSDKNISWLSDEVSFDDSPVAAATKCHHGDIVAMMQDIIKACRSVASAGGETAATMTDVSLTCQVQQLTSEVRSLSAVVAEKDEQIHLLETTVNDMKEVVTANGRQISFLLKAWANVKRFFGARDDQFHHVVPSVDQLSSCAAESPGSSLSASELQRSVTDVQILEVAKAAGDKWSEIGVYLGFKFTDMKDYEEKHHNSLSQRLIEVLIDWRRKKETATVGMLLSACEKAGVKGVATKALKKH